MHQHMFLMNNKVCVKGRSVFHIVSLGELSFLLKGIQPPSGFLIVSDARESCRRISHAVCFEPALKMQTEIFSTRRSHKDVTC
jgi:hypothetical protein